MSYMVSAAVVVLGVLVVLLGGALVEMYKNLELLREYSGLVDEPVPVEIAGEGTAPSALGLPAWLDEQEHAGVLFLSNRCSTCRSIVLDLSKMATFPPNLVLVIDRPDGHDGALAYDFLPEHCVVDERHRIFDRLELTTTPSLVTVRGGALAEAVSMPSTRRLLERLADEQPAPA